ncbi:MAG TPA: NAD(P)/FAD-dependent oxidoreductase, partial [Chthoniobacteraceae bacterium]|nr:NAD(P)/FAD-dependent oxidoreductase [Chthoniobacteraceae bacterium]
MTDAIVIGSGPNGLAAAITLAAAGRSVRVLEAQSTIGGGARSAELTLPGFIHDRCSAIHPLAAGSPFFRSLPLDRHGLEWVHPGLPLAHPLDDGTAAILARSLDETCAGLGEDGAAWRKLVAPLVRDWDALAGEFLQPMLHWPRHPFLLAQFGMFAIQSASGLARRLFRGEPARALFAGLAAHSFLALEAPLSAGFGLVLGAAGHAVGWPFPRGGTQRLTDALAAHLRQLGGTIETDHRVTDLGELPPARATLLDLSAWQAATVAGPHLPARYRRRLERFPHGPSIFKIDYALRGPIPWRAEACRRAGTVHLGGTLDEIALGERQVTRNEVPALPFVLLAQQSVFDSSRAPAGGHTAWAYCHIPFGCDADMTGAIEGQIERFAPGFRDLILARGTSGPAQIQSANFNLVKGDISGGASDFWSFFARPIVSFTPYRMPAAGLYLCSSSTPP